MYWIARFGPIEVGRVTTIPGDLPYFVTINAVAVKQLCNTAALPETAFIKAFKDFYAAEAYATSFFPPNTQPFIEWTQFN